MAPSQRSPRREESREDDNEKDKRKRVGKACDRCRLKKSKCCGQQPCHRCQVDNSICVYGERKKANEKIYAKGYTDQLVDNQVRLVKCVQLLYGHCIEANIPWDYSEVKRRPGSRGFLTYDILNAVGLMQPSTNEADDEEVFHDNPESLLEKTEASEVKDRNQPKTIKQGAETTSMYDAAIQTPCASVSRTSSLESVHFSGDYSTLEKLQVSGLPQYSHSPGVLQYQYTLGGQLPPTPTERPSEEESAHHYFNQAKHTMNVLNTTTTMPQADLFSGALGVIDPSPTAEVHPWGLPIYDPAHNQHYGHASLYRQHPAHPPGPPVQKPPTEGPWTTLAQPYESPMLEASGLPKKLPEEQSIRMPVALRTANDPDVGFGPFSGVDED